MIEIEQVEAADYLTRSALDFLVELLPIVDVHVAYRKAEELPDPEEITWSEAEGPIVHQDRRAVPAHPEYCRVVGISLSPRIRRFLRDSTDKYLQAAYNRLAIPLRLADRWTEQLKEKNHQEARGILRSKLPVHIVAHIMADRYAEIVEDEQYRFDDQRQDAHEALTASLVKTLEYMDGLTRSRVEHQELSHGVLLAAPRSEDHALHATGRYPETFERLKRTPLLADGFQAALHVNPAGRPVQVITRDVLEQRLGGLERDFGALSFIAEVSEQYEGLGLMLRPGGSIVSFADGQPLFIRRAGTWKGMLWNMIQDVMVARYGGAGARLFNAALILTTSGRGGILAVLEDDALERISEKDRVDWAREANADDAAETPAEWQFHRLLPTDDVTRLSAPTLAMLAGIDGATIVSAAGQMLAYGAIVPGAQSQSEGARTAAARALSEQGLVLKVSEDGPIQLFEDEEAILEA